MNASGKATVTETVVSLFKRDGPMWMFRGWVPACVRRANATAWTDPLAEADAQMDSPRSLYRPRLRLPRACRPGWLAGKETEAR